MKIRPSILALLLTLLVILMGCDNGSVSDSAAEKSSGLGKVCLSVDGDSGMPQKALWVDNYVGASLKYQYNAVPQWDTTGAAVSIQGATDWKAINYSDNMSLGYFTPGQWVFGVRILLHDNNEETEDTVIYEGFSSVISVANRSVEVTVEVHKLTTGASAGAVSINVTAPTIDAANDYLTVSYSENASITINAQSGAEHYSANNGITTYKYTLNNLSAGEYDFTLRHSSGGMGGAVAVELRSGEMAVISGYLESGNWQLGYLAIKVHEVNVSPTTFGQLFVNVETAVPGDRVSIYAKPSFGCTLSNLSVTYVDDQSVSHNVNYTQNYDDENLFTFVMPNADVTVAATFEETAINFTQFRSKVFELYNSNNVQAFGRSDEDPNNYYAKIKDVKIWYDESNNKICWHSPNNRLKLRTNSLAGFFRDCDKFTSISMAGFDTSEIIDLSSLFENCGNLKEVDLDGVNTASVEDMSKMFYKAGYYYFPSYTTGVGKEDQTHNHQDNSENLVISNMNFNTSHVVSMSYMFSVCAAVDLSGTNMSAWDVSNVEDMSFMFAGQSVSGGSWKYWYNKIASFPDISGWNTISCTSFKNMFALCNRFKELDISGWKFNNVVYIDRMFERCECLGMVDTQGDANDNIKLKFPEHTYMTKVQDMLYMFGKDVEFRRENLAAIVASWDFTGNPYADSLLGNATNGDTTPETVPSNRILSSECGALSDANSHRNFKTSITITTKDGRTLYAGGGTNYKSQRLRTTK